MDDLPLRDADAPELGWRFGYLWALALMVVVPAASVLWARKKKWL